MLDSATMFCHGRKVGKHLPVSLATKEKGGGSSHAAKNAGLEVRKQVWSQVQAAVFFLHSSPWSLGDGLRVFWVF